MPVAGIRPIREPFEYLQRHFATKKIGKKSPFNGKKTPKKTFPLNEMVFLNPLLLNYKG